MYQKIGKTPNAALYRVYNLDTGEEIKYCIEADDIKGTYVVYCKDEKGDHIIIDDPPHGKRIKTERRWGNIILIHRDEMRKEKDGSI